MTDMSRMLNVILNQGLLIQSWNMPLVGKNLVGANLSLRKPKQYKCVFEIVLWLIKSDFQSLLDGIYD